MNLETLFRRTLLVTFFMNMAGALAFVPQIHFLRELGGFPETGHPFYAWLVSAWILFFGIGYLRLAFSNAPERFFIAIGAAGKSSFAILLIAFALSSELPVRAAFAGLPDLAVAVIFAAWLYKTRAAERLLNNENENEKHFIV